MDRWVYYCVDDFSVWPGLDGRVLREMEAGLVQGVDRIIAASRALATRLAGLASPAQRPRLLTHGVDPEHWRPPPGGWSRGPDPWPDLRRPLFLFFGLVDRRLDTARCRKLTAGRGTLVLLGPLQRPDRALGSAPGVHLAGPVSYAELPRAAAAADVPPYADLSVTRAMQPLKLCEYMATGKPVVVRSLPATDAWRDGADVVSTADSFVQAARTRVWSGTPRAQLQARRRLAGQSWQLKTLEFEALLAQESRAGAAAA